MPTVDELQAQITALQALLDGMKGAGDREWPQVGDTYFEVTSNGYVGRHVYDYPEIDKPCIVQGNAFRTEAEATRERDRRALIHELR